MFDLTYAVVAPGHQNCVDNAVFAAAHMARLRKLSWHTTRLLINLMLKGVVSPFLSFLRSCTLETTPAAACSHCALLYVQV